MRSPRKFFSTKVQSPHRHGKHAGPKRRKLSLVFKPLIIVGAGDDTESDVSFSDMIFTEKSVDQEQEVAMSEEKQLSNLGVHNPGV
jgi:hypothetical protein